MKESVGQGEKSAGQSKTQEKTLDCSGQQALPSPRPRHSSMYAPAALPWRSHPVLWRQHRGLILDFRPITPARSIVVAWWSGVVFIASPCWPSTPA